MGKSEYPRCCANCKWSKRVNYSDGEFKAYECHRFPPAANGGCYGVFPRVEADDVCGEFMIMRKPRLKEAA